MHYIEIMGKVQTGFREWGLRSEIAVWRRKAGFDIRHLQVLLPLLPILCHRPEFDLMFTIFPADIRFWNIEPLETYVASLLEIFALPRAFPSAAKHTIGKGARDSKLVPLSLSIYQATVIVCLASYIWIFSCSCYRNGPDRPPYFKNPPDKFLRPVGLRSVNDGFPSFRCQVKYASPPRSMHVAGPPSLLLISRALGARLLHRSSETHPGGKILLEEEPLSSRATNYNRVSRHIGIASFINQNRLGRWNDFVRINHRLQIAID